MLNNAPFYHGIIKKIITVFGGIFSSIYIDRKEGDSVTGDTIQRLHIPLAYACKEKYIVRIDSDPNLTNHTYISLPRISFEITSYYYDPTRKLNKTNKITCGSGDGSMSYVYAPVPYNIDIALYILTKNQEDAMQILEQILPTFNPEYIIRMSIVPDMNIIQDMPIVLNTVEVDDQYEGDFQTRRFVIHTLRFTVKASLFGGKSSQGIIEHVRVNLGENPDFSNPVETFTADGDSSTGEITDNGWDVNF